MALEDKVESLEKKLDTVINLLQKAGYSFPTKKSVASYFSVSDRTIDYWIRNGKFEEGIEYYIDNIGRIRYITDGILNHQDKSNNKEHPPKLEITEQLNPIANHIIKSLSCLKN